MTVKGYAFCLFLQFLVHAGTAGPIENALTPADALVQIKAKAEAGDPVAQTRLADHYQGPLMFPAAKHWYEAAAVQGYPPAIAALGDLYSATRGFGTNRIAANPTNAFNLHRLAAAMGYDKSHYNVGMAYREGKIAPRNPILAYKHLKLAHSLIADQYLKKVILEMSQTEIKQAEDQTARFKPVQFRQAFQDLIFDTIHVGGLFVGASGRVAYVNGNSVAQGEHFTLSVAGLPARLKCESIEPGAIVISFDSIPKRISIGPKPPVRSSL